MTQDRNGSSSDIVIDHDLCPIHLVAENLHHQGIFNLGNGVLETL